MSTGIWGRKDRQGQITQGPVGHFKDSGFDPKTNGEAQKGFKRGNALVRFMWCRRQEWTQGSQIEDSLPRSCRSSAPSISTAFYGPCFSTDHISSPSPASSVSAHYSETIHLCVFSTYTAAAPVRPVLVIEWRVDWASSQETGKPVKSKADSLSILKMSHSLWGRQCWSWGCQMVRAFLFLVSGL